MTEQSLATRARKSFRNEGGEARRAALIAATLDCLAEGGPQAATVREIAARADVTQGLIRHYFPSKDHLLEAAYQALMDRLSEGAAALADQPGDVAPSRRLAAFVRAALDPGVIAPGLLAAWAGFVGTLHRSPGLHAIHAANYLGFRARLGALIGDALAAEGRATDPARLRALSIAATALLDGLWLEGGLMAEDFAPGEIAAIGLAAVSDLIDIDLVTDGSSR